MNEEIKNLEKKVVLSPEGTPLGDFQKARTDAMSAMFERDGRCGKIHSTSKLYADLDTAFLAGQKSREEEKKGCEHDYKLMSEKVDYAAKQKYALFFCSKCLEYKTKSL